MLLRGAVLSKQGAREVVYAVFRTTTAVDNTPCIERIERSNRQPSLHPGSVMKSHKRTNAFVK